MSVEARVRRHFDEDARRFDAIYEPGGGPVRRFVDGIWRGVVRRRFELALARLEPLAGKAVLDVGCGSGRYAVACAVRGAALVVGVDFAPAMIEIARALARRAGVEERCDFRVGDFPAAVPEEGFDAALGLGLFDYVREPVPLLQAMRARTRGLLILSFPRAREWRAPLRRLRFLLAGCPLYLYSERRTRALLREAGLDDFDWVPLDRDYVVIARTQARGVDARPLTGVRANP